MVINDMVKDEKWPEYDVWRPTWSWKLLGIFFFSQCWISFFQGFEYIVFLNVFQILMERLMSSWGCDTWRDLFHGGNAQEAFFTTKGSFSIWYWFLQHFNCELSITYLCFILFLFLTPIMCLSSFMNLFIYE